MSTLERFEAIADIYEKGGEQCSVCDSCERTYPMDWIINNRCPFCGKWHTWKEVPKYDPALLHCKS